MDYMDRKAIGVRLKTLRGKKPLKKVADDLGISPSSISMWENGERLPKDNAKIALAAYYNVSVQELFYYNESTL